MMNQVYRVFKKSKFDFTANLLIIIFCAASLFPLYWLLTGSFKYSQDIIRIPPDWIPSRVTLDNYINIFAKHPALRWIGNSLFVSGITTLGVILVSAATGYAVSKIRFRGKKLIFTLVIACLVMPKEIYLLPLYQQMVSYRWIGSMLGFIIPDIASPFGVYLMTNYYDTIPDEIYESASIDGSGHFRFFTDFALPLSKPGIAALGILTFIRTWNSYLWQFVMKTNENTYTLPVGIASLFDNPDIVDYGLKFAGASITAIPLLLIFMLFQKFFVSGITSGSVKG